MGEGTGGRLFRDRHTEIDPPPDHLHREDGDYVEKQITYTLQIHACTQVILLKKKEIEAYTN